MAQTPISSSVLYNSTTPTTIYTVPATKTAVVKGVLASSLTSSYDTVTVNKVSGGVTYPIVRNTLTGYAVNQSTYYYERALDTRNLLESPITLAAGDSISISTTGTSAYKTEYAVQNSNYRIGNIAYLNGNYVVVGIDNSTGTGLILTSTDGITYTKRTFSASVYLTEVVFGNGYYVVCNATGGTIHHSTDLVTWTQVSLPSTSPCFALVYGGGKFVTGGTSGINYYATSTPLSWTQSTTFNTNTIYAIAYIGTNYFYATSGISYYTADFTTYTQPYVSQLTGQNPGAIAASNDKVLVTNTLIPSSNANTFLRTSADGISWSAQTTTTNTMTSYQAYPVYAANGGYFITRINNNTGTGEYLNSANGTTWGVLAFSFLTGYSSAGVTAFYAAYQNTSNASYQNKILIYQRSGGSQYLQGCNISTSGVLSSQNFSFSSIPLGNGDFQGYPMFAGNPFNGTWKAVMYYANGGNNGAPFYYGTGPNQGVDSQRNDGLYLPSYGYSGGYGVSVGVEPNSARYYCGTTQGWVLRSDSASGGWYPLMGSPSYVGNPTGFDWTSAGSGGSAVCGFARSGDLSTSALVIVWNNGYFATTTNQGTSWTFGNIGMSTIPTTNDIFSGPIVYNNGRFVVMNGNSQIATSTNGITWTTMISGVENVYYLNSQNVFNTGNGTIYTSATGVVDAFTYKSITPSFGSNTSTNRIIYANSNYYIIDTNSNLYQSTDLITWTSKAFNTTQINDVPYFSPGSYTGLAYSGTGAAFVPTQARAASSTDGTGGVGKIFTPSVNTYVGNATASIVQID